MLAKRSDRGKEGVLPRIDWLAWVCGCSRQDGLGGRLENRIFCPLSGRDGQDRLDRRCLSEYVRETIVQFDVKNGNIIFVRDAFYRQRNWSISNGSELNPEADGICAGGMKISEARSRLKISAIHFELFLSVFFRLIALAYL